MIFISDQRFKYGNRDYLNGIQIQFQNGNSVTFEAIGNFLVVFVRLILGKVGVDGVTGPRREIDIRYKFDSKVFLAIIVTIFDWLSKQQFSPESFVMADGRVVETENLKNVLDTISKIKKKKEGQYEEKMCGRVWFEQRKSID